MPASAESAQPTAVSAIMPVSSLRRPIMSPRRGRNRLNSAAAVKNTVWVKPITSSVVFSSLAISLRAGESMEALSWKAKQATSNAVITAAVERLVALICHSPWQLDPSVRGQWSQ